MREYAVERVAGLLESFVRQLDHASRHRDEDSIHDLRVSIRRLSESLRVFRQFFPDSKVKKIRRRLKRLMDFAAAVRDRDISLKLLSEAGMPELAAAVQKERDDAERDLRLELQLWKQRGFPARWPQRLQMFTP